MNTDNDDSAMFEEAERVDAYFHRGRLLVSIVGLLSVFLALLIIAALFGPGFDPESNDPIWLLITGLSLVALIAAFGWVLWRRPFALIVSKAGVDLPLAFKHPLGWDKIHRIRRIQIRGLVYGRRDWLVIEPSPGVLPPLRLPMWRRLELWFQKNHGVRIPLHGLEADADDVVRSVERFRSVIAESP